MADQPARKMRMACSTYPFQSLPIEQALIRMDELGFHFADLSISHRPGAGHMTPAQVKDEPMAALEILEAAMDRSRVRISVLDLDSKAFDLSERGQVEAVCRLGRRIGAECVNVMRADTNDPVIDIRRLRDFGRLASDFGLVLAVEPQRKLTFTVAEAAEAAREGGFRITLDIGRMLGAGVPQEEWAPIYPVLGHVHLYDSTGEPGRRQVPWGKGRLDLPGLLASLKSAGYKGFLTAEYLSPEPGDPAPFDPEPELVKLRRAVEAYQGPSVGVDDIRR